MRFLVILVAALSMFLGFVNGREYEKERGIHSEHYCKAQEAK